MFEYNLLPKADVVKQLEHSIKLVMPDLQKYRQQFHHGTLNHIQDTM